MPLRVVSRTGWIAADSCYSNLGIPHFHNHMDQQYLGMMCSYCNLVVHSLFPNWLNYSQVAVCADHIDKLNENGSHYPWSYSPPDELAILRLPTQLLRENMRMSVLELN
ncbi:hypothetical protein M0R45_037179 [Rubus argutus]|uniref:Uncharacterized protein n=1 Tax=Rubus argutus TaxID=59490 RepID=A0AAW1W1L3_RUBAR